MMATSVMHRQKTGNWSAIFPTEQVTQQQSALFVKKLLAVAISNITYLRTIFPEHAFGNRSLEDLSLKILRDDSACPGACQVIQWVKGCFDALDRKYLRMIVVGIYVDADNPMTAVETYTFKFEYTSQKGITIFRNDMEVASAFTEAETKRATIKLLRTIIVLTQTLQPLPDDVMMTMKLCYYDEVTPEDYEPPGFQATSSEEFGYEEAPVTIKVGDVNTPFHAVRLRIKTSCSQFTPADGTGEVKDSMAIEDKEVNMDRKNSDCEDNLPDTGQTNGQAHEPTECEQSRVTMDTKSLPNFNTMHSSESNTVRCPCGVNEDDGLMVSCGVCQVWQHAVCFSLLKEEQVPDLHICVRCAKTNHRQCTDPSLNSLTPAKLQSMCLWRRTLHACSDLTRLLIPGLARRLGVEVGVAQGIMERLESEGYVRPPTKGRKWGRMVVKEKIKEGMQKYFNKQLQESAPPLSLSASRSTDKSLVEPHLLSSNKVDILTHKAADLSISKAESIKGEKPPTSANLLRHLDRSECEVRRSPRIRAKRVRSVLDETKEFELSCSQEGEEGYDCGDRKNKKRRKASIASRSIMV